MSQLLVNEKGAERAVDLAQQAVIHIGRGSDNEIVINDPRSSRKHCRLSRTPQGWVLEDLKSRNGTQLKGAAVERTFLKDGDEFAIGSTRFRLREPAAPSPDEAPAGKDSEDELVDDLLMLPEAEEEQTPPPAAVRAAETRIDPGHCRLEGLEGDHAGERIPIPRFPFTIGRSKENDFRIADQKASGHHARIVESGSRLYLEDLKSRNGTFLNQKKVTRAPLAPGSTIQIGACSFRMEMPKVDEPEGAPDEAEPEAGGPVEAADFSRFDAREFLREGDRASPLAVGAILLVLGTLLYFAVDVTMKSVRRADPDPAAEENALANSNWSFEEPLEKGKIPGWAMAEGSEGTITVSAEGAQFPGQRALRLRPAGAGRTEVASLRDIPIDSREKYKVAAHVTNLGSLVAGVSVTWLAESEGKRVVVGRDWGSAVREEVRQEDLERETIPPALAVFARVMPFVIDAADGKGEGAAFDRIYFAGVGKRADSEEAVAPDGDGTEEGTPGEEEKEPTLPMEVRNGAEDAALAGGPMGGLPIHVQVSADGTLRDLQRGGRLILQSMWAGLGSDADPLALGPRLLTRLKQASEREGVFLLSQLPDTHKGEWVPLETRVQGQGGEIQCELRFGRGRSTDAATPDRVLIYMVPGPALKEVLAFGGALKSPAAFPPDRPEAGPIEELQFGSQGEQTVLIFKPPVTLRAIPHPDMEGRSLLVAEALLAGEPEARGRKAASAMLSVRISPFSRREDEAVAALLRDAAQLHRESKPGDARARLRELETRYPWRSSDIARAGELVKGWNEEAEQELKEIEAGINDLAAASSSPFIREALLARTTVALERFRETPVRGRLDDADKKIRKLIPDADRAGEGASEPLLKEARTHLDRGEIGLADLCVRLARESKLTAQEEESLNHLNKLIVERRKQRASEEVR